MLGRGPSYARPNQATLLASLTPDNDRVGFPVDVAFLDIEELS